MHFFIEGVTHARADDFGVSIESVWEYASRRTQQHTVSVGRPQTPEKRIRELTATGPIYLGYSRRRSAQITFSPELAGRFLGLRLIGTVEARFARTRVSYDSGENQERYAYGGGLSITALLPLLGWPMPLFLSLRAGMVVEPVTSVAFGSESTWTAMPALSLGVSGWVL